MAFCFKCETNYRKEQHFVPIVEQELMVWQIQMKNRKKFYWKGYVTG